MIKYLAGLPPGRIVLWCYLLWYLFFVAHYFDPAPALWITSLGISCIVGIALILSTSGGENRLSRWQIFRLFLMPFCVSSFSALVKGHGFVLVFSPHPGQDLAAAGLCAAFCLVVLAAKRLR
jgi:Na+/H+-dicarboxylate symporter